MDNLYKSLCCDVSSFQGYTTIGQVFCRYWVKADCLPTVFTFSNLGRIYRSNSDEGASFEPWSYRFLKEQDLNIFSFASMDQDNWYRDPCFINGLKHISASLQRFPIKLGYGGSMGGFAAAAYSELLGLDRVLLLNPISTLNPNLAPWETRFNKFRHFNWNSDYHDGAAVNNTRGYVVYDPIHTLDAQHARRFKSLEKLKIPGVGHGISAPMLKLGMLKKTFQQFVEGKVNQSEFHRLARRRRELPRYYDWLLSNENIHLTENRKRIVDHFKNRLSEFSVLNEDKFIDSLRDAAVELESSRLDLSYVLMRKASLLRPNGPFIKRKLEEYQIRLGKLDANSGEQQT